MLVFSLGFQVQGLRVQATAQALVYHALGPGLRNQVYRFGCQGYVGAWRI